MPNFVAYLVLYSWPVVVIVMFQALDRPKAIAASIVAGYLLLPSQPGLDLPALPVLDKTLIPAFSAAIMCLVLGPKDAAGHQTYGGKGNAALGNKQSSGGRMLLIALMVVLFASGFASVLTNGEALQFGPTFLPAMRAYDGFSVGLETLVFILPFLLGMRYLTTESDHKTLLGVLAAGGVAYSLLALFEVRMSPQLNLWIYGYFPHSFAQHVRGGGFRPIVFLEHGLWVSMFLAMATLAGAALLRSSAVAASNSLRWMMFLAWMLVTLVLVKSLGSLVITLLLLPVILFGTAKMMLRVSLVIALIVLSYPMLRGLDWVPVDKISDLATRINPERAHSFNVRIYNENVLLARAQEKPYFGWGGWGRNEIYDPETGRNIVITDGMWVIFVGMFGWFGYIARFGLLAFPLLTLSKKRKARPVPLATSALALVSAANLIDLIPNATLTPVTWLVAGALTGYAINRHGELTEGAAQSGTSPAAPELPAQTPRPKNIRRPRA